MTALCHYVTMTDRRGYTHGVRVHDTFAQPRTARGYVAVEIGAVSLCRRLYGVECHLRGVPEGARALPDGAPHRITCTVCRVTLARDVSWVEILIANLVDAAYLETR